MDRCWRANSHETRHLRTTDRFTPPGVSIRFFTMIGFEVQCLLFHARLVNENGSAVGYQSPLLVHDAIGIREYWVWFVHRGFV